MIGEFDTKVGKLHLYEGNGCQFAAVTQGEKIGKAWYGWGQTEAERWKNVIQAIVEYPNGDEEPK